MVALESVLLFLFTTPPPTQTYPLSLHDALPIFDVIDEVGAMQMLVPPSKRKKTITPKEIEAVIATMARIPPKTVSTDDKKVLETLETDLKRVVFGQNKAIDNLSSAIKLSRAGLRDPEKPIGCYLFTGPTGV